MTVASALAVGALAAGTLAASGKVLQVQVVRNLPGGPVLSRSVPHGRLDRAHGAGCAGDVVVERTVYAMGTLLRLELTGHDRWCALAASEAVVAEVGRLERLLSSWEGESEVGRLNNSPPGRGWPIAGELRSLLEEARWYVVLTGGAFDPGVGALVAVWDMRGGGRVPSAPELAAALGASGLQRLGRDSAAGTVTRPSAHWSLDTGGFGKGVALRSAAAVLRSHGVQRALLDFGGQLLVVGPAREVAVAHAGRRTEALPWRLRVGGGSVSTTSSSERFVAVAGARLGHVLDPRIGRPVPAWGSVTVVAADAVAADAVSTGLFVLGPDSALSWAAAHPEFGVLVQQFAGDGVRVRHSSNLQSLLVSSEPEVITK